jgi:hypothetical protein
MSFDQNIVLNSSSEIFFLLTILALVEKELMIATKDIKGIIIAISP